MATPSSEQPLSRTVALLEAALAALIASAAIALFVAMPELVAEGGIQAAQDFLRLSPVFFPRLTFGVLSILGLSYFVIALHQLRTADSSGGGIMAASTFGRVLTIFAFAMLYPAVLPWFGYGLTTLLLLAAVTLFLGNRIWWQVTLFAVGAPVAIRFIFERMLKISMPRADIDAIGAVEEAVMQALSRLLLS